MSGKATPKPVETVPPVDLFAAARGKFAVDARLAQPRVTYYGFHTFAVGRCECSVGRADLSKDVVVSVVDPEHGTTQMLISSQDLVQEAMRVHRERTSHD